MGYDYGIKQCRETLLSLSSDESFEKRIIRAHSEIGVIDSEDVPNFYFQEILDWKKEYISTSLLIVDKKGTLKEIDKEKKLINLSQKLVFLCVQIIEHNSKNQQ